MLFCRMPDSDFSVNDVKMFVGKIFSFLMNALMQVQVFGCNPGAAVFSINISLKHLIVTSQTQRNLKGRVSEDA